MPTTNAPMRPTCTSTASATARKRMGGWGGVKGWWCSGGRGAGMAVFYKSKEIFYCHFGMMVIKFNLL